jgi:methyl-accepting chemotaxis protein
MHNIVNLTAQKQALAARLDRGASDLLAEERAILIAGLMDDQNAIRQYQQQFATTTEEMQRDIDTLRPLLLTEEGRQATIDLQQGIRSMAEANRTILAGSTASDSDQAMTGYSNSLPSQKRQKAAAAVLLRLEQNQFAEDARGAEQAIAGNRWMTALLLVLSCGVGLALIFVIRQINALLRGSVEELALSSEQIVSAANQISSGSQLLAQSSSQQAATIEETSSAATEINSMAQRARESSRNTSEIVNSSQGGFAKANTSLTEMIGAMDGIGEASQKISKIIQVIDEIAFQTNILALNAAVEAARAGEAGMGFAVVAEEVRNLAQRSAQAAKDTTSLIEDSMQRSQSGKGKVDQVAQSLHSITAQSSKIKMLVDEINQGSVEQSRGIEQISNAITQMEQTTQSTAANAEKSAASAEELNAQAESMREVVERLRRMVDGDHFAAGARMRTHSLKRTA